jgi:two-component system chemotaxis sensor kinase CheA
MGLLLSWCREGSPGVDQTLAQAYQQLANQIGLGKESGPESGPGLEPETAAVEIVPATILDLAADQELVQNFISEALEHLDSIETQIVYLEQDPTDKERINAIFRPFHTIKGVAGFLNLDQIQAFAHELETLLDEARSGRLFISGEIIDFILNAVDILKGMINDLNSSLETGKPLQVIDLKPHQATIKSFLQGKEEPGREPEKRMIGEILLEQGAVQEDDLEAALVKQREIKKSCELGEILVAEGKVAPQQIAQALVQQMQEQPSGRETSASQTIKIDVQKLDFLVDMMGELVIVQSQVQQNPLVQGLNDQKLVRNFSQMARITSELQKISMSLRMVPIGQTFQKMVRVVRDLSRKSGKIVELHLAGEDTEIDRNMVEAIYDPLVHMVRNSVDHGLEIPAQRSEAGKSEKGNLWLRAYHKGGNVVIEIEDDGQGLNRERILAKARDQGLLQEGENLTSTQIDNLVFEPGFSTAAQITDVSGRGVGMDVVKRTIDNLRGKIDISSNTGKGSRFTIRLPLTLAIIDGMIVQVGNERYIIPTIAVQQTLRPALEDYHTVQAKGEMIKVRNSLLPLLRLHHMFGVAAARQNPTEALVLVVENEGEQKCIMVDQIVGKQEVVIKSLGETFNDVKGLAGGTILGDGRVGLILDLNGLFALSKGSAATFH